VVLLFLRRTGLPIAYEDLRSFKIRIVKPWENRKILHHGFFVFEAVVTLMTLRPFILIERNGFSVCIKLTIGGLD
jgi:hypothetical protein